MGKLQVNVYMFNEKKKDNLNMYHQYYESQEENYLRVFESGIFFVGMKFNY